MIFLFRINFFLNRCITFWGWDFQAQAYLRRKQNNYWEKSLRVLSKKYNLKDMLDYKIFTFENEPRYQKYENIPKKSFFNYSKENQQNLIWVNHKMHTGCGGLAQIFPKIIGGRMIFIQHLKGAHYFAFLLTSFSMVLVLSASVVSIGLSTSVDLTWNEFWLSLFYFQNVLSHYRYRSWSF